METLVQSPSDKSVELQFLTGWEQDPARTREAGIFSVALHVAAIVALILVPRSFTAPPPPRETPQVTPLIEPLTELTQKAPNKGPLAKEVSAPAVQPRPRMHAPPSPPPAPRTAARQSAPPPSPPPMPEPPRVDTSHALPKGPQTAQAVPPPQIQPEEKPKLQFETPTAPPPISGQARIPIPDTSVSGAIRQLSRGGAEAGLTVGDAGDAPGGIGEMLNLPASPGRSASALQLLSDPLGVDFRPYLMQVLNSVRRNWFAVWPESAKLGRRGKVEIQFAISHNGGVPKLVIVLPSGADALDRAAVAGISASNPFPPLPTAYSGGTIRLQLTFQYNVPRH